MRLKPASFFIFASGRFGFAFLLERNCQIVMGIGIFWTKC